MFFITGLEKDGKQLKNGKPDYGCTRTFGYRETEGSAEAALNMNMADMHECVYEYAVIEDIPEGKVVGRNDRRRWFQWDYVKKGFFAIKKPNPYDVTENFALK